MTTATLSKPIILVGMMGSGKSSLGRELAQKLNVPFHDADGEIEKEAQQKITTLFETAGEAHFRSLEEKIMARLITGTPSVIAAGGGAVLSAATRALIKEKALGIWLKAPHEALLARTKGDKNRPLLKAADPVATLVRLLKEREVYYAEAPIHIDTTAQDFEETVEALALAVHNTLFT